MNLIPATVLGEHGRLWVRSAGVEVPLWDGDVAERPIVLGVRPEHLRATHGGGLRFYGRVLLLENLGSEEVAVCAVGEVRVAVRGARPLGLAPGDEVVLTADLEKIHLFDPETGRRLRWVDEPPVAEPVREEVAVVR